MQKKKKKKKKKNINKEKKKIDKKLQNFYDKYKKTFCFLFLGMSTKWRRK